MTFGVTPEGFKIKRLEDIQEETKKAWEGEFGVGFDLDPRAPAGQIKNILDERISLLWELGNSIFSSQYPRSSEGVPLDNAVALTGITRIAATKSRVEQGRARGDLATVVPAGTIISVDGNANSRFVTDADAAISIPAVNEVQAIAFDADPDAGDFKMVFPEGTTIAIAHDANLAAIQAAVDTVLGGGNSVVAGAIDDVTGLTITYQGALAGTNRAQVAIADNNLTSGGPAVVVTPSTTTEGDTNKSPLIILTQEDASFNTNGPLPANTGSLTVIETPVVGLNSFNNEADAIVGRNEETDAELKVRQVQEVQVAGAATPEAIRADILQLENVTAVVVFVNRSSIVDIDGREPHSVDIVVENGDEDEIAEAIFNNVAAGIGFNGDITKVVTDSQNFAQEVKFSRPDPVEIHVEVDLTINAAIFPLDGAQQVEDAILAYGNALKIGEDVVVFGSSPSLSCSFQGIPGIVDFEIRVDDAPGPVGNANVTIDPREIADFDSARITVVIP